MAESKREGGGRKWGPPSEEERQQREGEFKQAFLEEYRKRHGDSPISADQTWELFMAVKDQWRAKKMERRHEHQQSNDQDDSGQERQHSPGRFGERRKQMIEELHTDFQKDFTAAHGNNNINADQAWALIQQVKRNKREKWQGEWQKHGHGHGHGHGRGRGHGHGHGGRHSPPEN